LNRKCNESVRCKMTAGAMIFMVLSWAAVLGLTLWAFARLLRTGRKG
jgi:type IV secretory pathway TrbD component